MFFLKKDIELSNKNILKCTILKNVPGFICQITISLLNCFLNLYSYHGMYNVNNAHTFLQK